VDDSVFTGIELAISADRPAYLSSFLASFYSLDSLGGKRISGEAVRLSWNLAAGASPKGTLDCVRAWLTDFREDLGRTRIPTLVIHGETTGSCRFPHGGPYG